MLAGIGTGALAAVLLAAGVAPSAATDGTAATPASTPASISASTPEAARTTARADGPARPAVAAYPPGRGDRTAGYRMRTEARFAPPGALVRSAALTYDTDLVPAAAWIGVSQHTAPRGDTTVRLRVAGLRPGHAYGVHVHQKPCTADPAAAGGHYQHEPGAGEHHVSEGNEVWLDVTPGADGAGRAVAHHDWGFRQGEASSVVLHDEPGSKGARVACFTVPFGWVAD